MDYNQNFMSDDMKSQISDLLKARLPNNYAIPKSQFIHEVRDEVERNQRAVIGTEKLLLEFADKFDKSQKEILKNMKQATVLSIIAIMISLLTLSVTLWSALQ